LITQKLLIIFITRLQGTIQHAQTIRDYIMISISVYVMVLVIKHSKIEKAPKLVEVIDGGVSPLPILTCLTGNSNCLFIRCRSLTPSPMEPCRAPRARMTPWTGGAARGLQRTVGPSGITASKTGCLAVVALFETARQQAEEINSHGHFVPGDDRPWRWSREGCRHMSVREAVVLEDS
jgi:hypothetical protein